MKIEYVQGISPFVDVLFPIDEKDCLRLSMRCHCVLATSMEISTCQAYATTMVRPCHVVKSFFVMFMIPIVLFKSLFSLFI